jgi:hypothetical protein
MRRIFRRTKSVIKLVKYRHFDRFVFIHINKTGGSSIEKALNIPFEHKTAIEKIEEIGKNKWERKFTFTVVRNPWDKVVSHYHYRVKTNQTRLRDNPVEFKEWVKRAYGEQDPFFYDKPKMFMPQVNWITDKDGNVLVNEIIHFENLESEFNRLLKRLNRKTGLPHVKNSNRSDYPEYYDEVTIEIVRSWFKKDIEMFSYQF